MSDNQSKSSSNKLHQEQDDANDLSQAQPRRKASEKARNILMNWLVENEGNHIKEIFSIVLLL
jgi:hypothetical protein